MTKDVLIFTVAAVALLLAPEAARGQEAGPASGPTPGWSFTPAVSFGAIYDSNISLANDPAGTGRASSDRLLVVQPSGQLAFVSPRTQFTTGYAGHVRRYVDFSQLNGFDQRAYASVRRLATKRLTFSLGNTYAQVPTTDELELNGVPFSLTGSRRNTASASVDTRLTKYTNLSIVLDHTWVSFFRTEALLTGGWVAGGRADLTRRLRERLSAGGEYAIRFAEFAEGARQVTFHDVGGTVRVGLSERTTAGFATGVSFLNDRTLQESRRGPYLRADVTRDTEYARFGASFERAFVPSFGFGGSSRSQQLRGFVHMPIDQHRMYVQGSASWRRSDPLLRDGLFLYTTALRSTVGYAAARQVRLEVVYTLTRQDTRVAGGKINRQRVGAQVVIAQPMRIQ